MALPAPTVTSRGDQRRHAFPPAGVRAVVFDVVHTLVEPWPPVAAAYHEAGLRHGVAVDRDTIQARFRTAWRREEARDAAATPAFATTASRERDRWRNIVAEVFAEVSDTGEIFADLWDHFAAPSAWRALPLGRDLVMAARAAGVPVVLASNFDERLFALAAEVEPLTFAENVFASSELGWRKPSPRFFRAVEERLALEPRDLVLVGDDPDLDVAAARRAGWQARGVA